MDFAAMPPEVNSARMYAGPGAGPILAAAAAWDEMSAQLFATATSYHAVVSGLTGTPWQGSSAVSMAAAAAASVAWVTTAATHAEQTATAARAAAAAYEAAFTMTVPPPVIAANRALLMTLVVTNFLGQNTPAIAAAEAQYAQMWAQDATAMYGYAGASAAASAVPSFTSPVRTAIPDVLVNLHRLITALPAAIQELSLPLLGVRLATIPATYITAALGGKNVGNMLERLSNLPAALAASKAGPGSAVGELTNPASVSAGLGQAARVGKLSVPRAWISAAPAIKPVVVAPAPVTVRPGTLWPQMALASMAGRAVGAVASSRNK